MSKISNTTQVDAAGARLGLYREPDESIYDFQLRLRSAMQYGFSRSKESFEDSLDYITANRTRNLFVIEKPANLDGKHISFDGVMWSIDGADHNIKDYKFVKNIVELLVSEGYSITELGGYSEFLKTKNILQFDTNRHEINMTTPATQLFEIDRVGIKNVVDEAGVYKLEQVDNFEKDYDGFNKSDSSEEFFTQEENGKTLVLRENYSEDVISFDYVKFPIVVRWSVFNYYSLNDKNFDYRIKSLSKVSFEDTEKTPYQLTQEGAKLLNQCYKLSNTYWGK